MTDPNDEMKLFFSLIRLASWMKFQTAVARSRRSPWCREVADGVRVQRAQTTLYELFPHVSHFPFLLSKICWKSICICFLSLRVTFRICCVVQRPYKQEEKKDQIDTKENIEWKMFMRQLPAKQSITKHFYLLIFPPQISAMSVSTRRLVSKSPLAQAILVIIPL